MSAGSMRGSEPRQVTPLRITLQHRRTVWLVALLALMFAGVLSFSSARDYFVSQSAVERALAIQQAADGTLSLLKDAETGQRGFLLTQQPEFLVPHTLATQRLGSHIEGLRTLARYDPEQARSANAIAALASDKLAELAQTIELGRAGEREAALAMVREGRGRRLMSALREEVARVLERAQRDLEARRAALHDRFVQTSAASFACLIVATLSILGGLWTAERDIRTARQRTEDVRASELALRVLANHASDLVRVVAADGRTVYASPSCAVLLGYSVPELLGLAPEALAHPDDYARLQELAARTREADTGSSPMLLHRMRTRSGAERWFETRMQLASGYGEPGSMHVTSHDVTERKLIEDALKSQTAWLESVLSTISDGVIVVDADRRFRVVNPAAREYLQEVEGEVSSDQWSKRNRAYLPDGMTVFPPDQGPIMRALRGEAVDGVEMLIIDREGRPRAFSVSGRPLLDEARVIGAVAVFHDVTEQQSAAKALHESEQRFRVLSDASFEAVAITQTGIVVDVNSNFARLLGTEPAELIGRVGLSLYAPEDRDLVNRASDDPNNLFEARMLRADGTRLILEVRGREATFRGELVRLVVIRDVTEKRAQETELRRQAELLLQLTLRDELTGLYNRRGFIEHATKQLSLAVRRRSHACLFFVDLNGMKAINDGFGHEAGDRALIAAARALRAVFRDADVVARLGGDEFAVLASDCSEADIDAVRMRVHSGVNAYNATSGEAFRLAMSVGAMVFDPSAPMDLEALIAAADAKMYEQKVATSDVAPRNRPRSGPLHEEDERKVM